MGRPNSGGSGARSRRGGGARCPRWGRPSRFTGRRWGTVMTRASLHGHSSMDSFPRTSALADHQPLILTLGASASTGGQKNFTWVGGDKKPRTCQAQDCLRPVQQDPLISHVSENRRNRRKEPQELHIATMIRKACRNRTDTHCKVRKAVISVELSMVVDQPTAERRTAQLPGETEAVNSPFDCFAARPGSNTQVRASLSRGNTGRKLAR